MSMKASDNDISEDPAFDWGDDLNNRWSESLARGEGADSGSASLSRSNPAHTSRSGSAVGSDVTDSDDKVRASFYSTDSKDAQSSVEWGGAGDDDRGDAGNEHNDGSGGDPKAGETRGPPGGGAGAASGKFNFRRAAAIASVVGAVVAASLAVGYVAATTPRGGGWGRDARSEGLQGGQRQQQLLEAAERINVACGGDDPAECERLCLTWACCFDDGEGSCANDEAMDCAAYAGCVALV